MRNIMHYFLIYEYLTISERVCMYVCMYVKCIKQFSMYVCMYVPGV